MKIFHVIIASLLLLLAPLTLNAENSTRISGYTIHHNALTTNMLSPEVARNYNIRRSRERAMLNISIIKDIPGSAGKAVTAEVKAVARNLIGQTRDVTLREIRDGDAIYYIGDFQVAHMERLTFLLDVKPSGESKSLQAKLEQVFYTK